MDKRIPYHHASSQNIYRRKTSKRRQGLRVCTLGYSTVPHKMQNEVCLVNYHECEHYKRQTKIAPEEALPSKNHMQGIESKSKPPLTHQEKTTEDTPQGHPRWNQGSGSPSNYSAPSAPPPSPWHLSFLFHRRRSREIHRKYYIHPYSKPGTESRTEQR